MKHQPHEQNIQIILCAISRRENPKVFSVREFRVYENDGEFDGGMKLARVQIAAIRITMCGVLVIISKILNSIRHSHKIYC